MDPSIEIKSTEDRMNLIRECIDCKDPVGVKKLILEDKFDDESAHWELLSLLGPCVSQENLELCPGFVDVSHRCMNYVIKIGKAKELLLALLEQAEELGDSVRFATFLQLIQNTILKITSGRVGCLEIALETLANCIRNLELPEDMYHEHEERRAQDLDPVVAKINVDVKEYLDFFKPFVEEVRLDVESEVKNCAKQREILVKYLLKVIDHPLAYLDLTAREENGLVIKANSRLHMETVTGYLMKLTPNISALIDSSNEETNRLMRKRKHTEMDSELLADIPPVLSLCCLSYFMHVEQFEQTSLSCLVTKKGIFESNMKFIQILMLRQENEIRRKGVALFMTLVKELPPGIVFEYEDLDRPEYFGIIGAIFDIMIHSPDRELRQCCVKVFPSFIQYFCYEARYQISVKLFGTLTHAGAYGFCVNLFKNQMEEILSNPEMCSEDAEFFIGLNLKRIFLLICNLPEGPATDLVENSDRIIAVLNLMRYLILRDPPKKNLTGFWNFIKELETDFLKPLQVGIDMSKGHYALEVEGIEKGNDSKATNEEEVEMSVSVAGFKMPKMARGQKIAVMRQALNTLDLINSLVVRVNELLEQQVKEISS
ncbi:hypothetical protein ACF0H5_005873 [Mactra antiquata]